MGLSDVDRRQFFNVIGSAGIGATAGCSTVVGSEPLSDPTVHTDSPGRRSLEWLSNGESVGELGVSGTVSSGLIDLSTEISHTQGTNVESIQRRVWMASPDTETSADIAIVSPVEGDSSPPPSISLYSPHRSHGTVIEITELDDLKDETISTLDLLVSPQSEMTTTLHVDATIALTGGGLLSDDYTLDGQLHLEFPELSEQ